MPNSVRQETFPNGPPSQDLKSVSPSSSRIPKSFLSHVGNSVPLKPVREVLWRYAQCYLTISLVALVLLPSEAQRGDTTNCSSLTDNYLGNAQKKFQIMDWVTRGICVRGDNTDPVCYARLERILESNLNELRKAEYAGAAGVLALLPTIGALLGTPTNEIWRLLTMIPFGGALAMASSFGGAILPVRISDYESAFMKENINNGRLIEKKSIPSHSKDAKDQTKKNPLIIERIMERASILMEQVEKKLRGDEEEPVPKTYVWVGLVGMALLLISAHVAMGLVEQGAVLPWWCLSRWWMHLWYLMGE
jgi:hypothetical protein